MEYCSGVCNNTRRLLQYTAYMHGSCMVKRAKGLVVVHYMSSDSVGDTCKQVSQDMSSLCAGNSSAVKQFECRVVK